MNDLNSIRQFVAVLAVLALAGCGVGADAGETATAPAAVPVRVAAPGPLDGQVEARAVGRLEAADETALSFRTGGVIRDIRVDIGDRVRRGQVLATLESTDVGAAVTRAQQQRDLAARDLERWRALAEQQLVARKTAEDARTALRTAEADLASAQFARRYTTIVADADGMVLERRAEAGETVLGGQPILRISGEEEGWRVRLEVADRDAVRIEIGAIAQVRVDAFPARALRGKVVRIGGQADRDSGAVAVELAIDDSELALKSGLIAKAEIALSQQDGLAVPVEALVHAEGEAGAVMVVRDGIARRLSVTLGEIEGERVAIRSGLATTAQVIVEGAAYVDDGQPVVINR